MGLFFFLRIFANKSDGTMTTFEMKWNLKKANISNPHTFLASYPIKEACHRHLRLLPQISTKHERRLDI